MALATPNQLWRLNKEGQLLLVSGLFPDPATPLTHVEADVAIKQALGVVEDGVCSGTSEAH